jgi:hypothetical protein
LIRCPPGHTADMLEHRSAAVRQMLIEADRVLGLAEQFRELPLAIQERRIVQVAALMLDQVEREQHRAMVAAAAGQRVGIPLERRQGSTNPERRRSAILRNMPGR